MIEDDAIADGRSAAAGASHIFLRVALEFGRHASSPLLRESRLADASGIVRFATLLIAMQDFSGAARA